MPTVVREMLRVNPDIKELIVWSRDLLNIYVVRSENIERCGVDVEILSHAGYHALDYLANATEAGDCPTYVLSDDLVKAYAAALAYLQQQEDEWDALRARQVKKGALA
jgi:hypothetical protein